MKISAFFVATAVTAKTTVRRDAARFDEIFNNQGPRKAGTDSLWQTLAFYAQPALADSFSWIEKALSYGCWCQIRTESLTEIVAGHGPPVDEFDAACKAWQSCISCTGADAKNEGDTCEFSETIYEVGFNQQTNRIDCGFNDSNCAINKCTCDENLAFTLVELSSVFNEDFVTTADGGFDFANECKATNNGSNNGNGNNGGNGNGNGGNGGGDSSDEAPVTCCGQYPNRFVFNDQGGNRACCGDVTYNTANHDCCSNELSAIGTCPA